MKRDRQLTWLSTRLCTDLQMMERGIQIKGAEDPDPRAFDTDAVLVSQEEIEEQFAQVINNPDFSLIPSRFIFFLTSVLLFWARAT